MSPSVCWRISLMRLLNARMFPLGKESHAKGPKQHVGSSICRDRNTSNSPPGLETYENLLVVYASFVCSAGIAAVMLLKPRIVCQTDSAKSSLTRRILSKCIIVEWLCDNNCHYVLYSPCCLPGAHISLFPLPAAFTALLACLLAMDF